MSVIETTTARCPVFLSVVIACHGRASEFLWEQLESLAAQDYRGAWEVIIADNGMSGSSKAVVDSFSDRLPGLVLVDVSQVAGQASAINAAVGSAAGTHLVLLDADDTVVGGYLRHLAEALQDHDFVGARLDAESLNPQWLQERRKPLQDDGLETLLNYRPAVVGAGMAISRSAFLHVGGFDEQLPTQLDVDLSWRLSDAGYEPFFVREAVVQYRYRADLVSTFRQERSYGAGEVLLYAKHRRHGLGRRPLRRTIRGYLEVIRALSGVGTRGGRARLATVTGAALGRLQGSLRHRIRYL